MHRQSRHQTKPTDVSVCSTLLFVTVNVVVGVIDDKALVFIIGNEPPEPAGSLP